MKNCTLKNLTLKSLLSFVLILFFNISHATIYTVGTGAASSTSTSATPFSNAVSDARRQYIIQASELTSQGAHFANISSLAFNVGSTFNANALNSFNLKIKQTSATLFSGTFDDVGLTTVYTGTVSVTASGWKTFAFSNNFFWDGTSNLLIEVCYNNSATSGTSTSIIATQNLTQYCQYVTGTASSVGCNLGPAATTVNTRPNMQLNLLAVNCSGMPGTGTITAPSTYCMTGATLTLTLSGYQLADGITRQWYSAPASSGPWTTVTGGANVTTLNTTISQSTYFTCASKCTNTNDSAAAPSVLVTGIAHYNCECVPTALPLAKICFTNWTLNGVSNSSSCGSTVYSDYRSVLPMATTTISSMASFSLTREGCYPRAYPADYIYICIDFNHNGIFDNAELVYQPSDPLENGQVHTVSGSFLIPATALTGVTGLRIGNFACYNFSTLSEVETEDYLINIQPQTPCNGAPAVGTITGVDSICSGTSFTLVHQIYATNSGVSYQWQSAVVNGNFSNISGATDGGQVTTSITQTLRYRLRAVCNATHDTVYTPEKLISKNTWISCYCIPAGENNGTDRLVRVQLNEIDNYFSVPTGNPAGYNTIYTPIANIFKNASNPLRVYAFGDAQNIHSLIVYIDYNHDGTFSASELIGSGGPDDSTPAMDIPFTIPASAMDGLTRMRVRCVRQGTESPCGTGSAGSGHSQTGDYYVNISPAPAPALSLKIYFSGFYSGGSLAPAMFNGGVCPNSSMCDSVIIELHHSTSPYALAYSTIGTLDVSGNTSLSYPVSAFGNAYYIVVKHRNSLETWSKNPVILYPATTQYDFTK